MSGEVFSLSGEPTPYAGTPHQGLVNMLERLLEMARSGEVQGVGYVALYRDRAAIRNSAGLLGTYGMLGASVCLTEDLRRIVDSE